MFNRTNPRRSKYSQAIHDKMIRSVANALVALRFNVMADHIGWINGTPPEVGGFVPDLAAARDNHLLFFEVETCTTYTDDYTRAQLAAFSRKAVTHVIVPPSCRRDDNQNYDAAADLAAKLAAWGLDKVQVGTCDPITGATRLKLEPDGGVTPGRSQRAPATGISL